MNRTTIAILATLTLLAAAVIIIILIAQGYQFDFRKKELTATGILVATSDPDGAEVLINGQLKTATNNTINLSPGSYNIKITKDGFTPWEKTLPIKSGEVYKTNVFLLPNLPDLRPLTLTGAKNPVLSPDGTKIAYEIASASAEKNGIWVVDMGRLLGPIPSTIFSAPDFKQVARDTVGLTYSNTRLLWDSDSRQLLAYLPREALAQGGFPREALIQRGFPTPANNNQPAKTATVGASLAYLLDATQINPQPNPLYGSDVTGLLTQWQTTTQTKLTAQTSKLPVTITQTLATTSANLVFSPDENKILYQATGSAYLPTFLPTPLPGSDPTPQVRNLTAANFYVYDIKEDRNYVIANCTLPIAHCVWFPSSRHLLVYTDKEIAIMEYDGENKAVVYAGPFLPGIVYAWPNWSKIVILTSLNSATSLGENLYTINLR